MKHFVIPAQVAIQVDESNQVLATILDSRRLGIEKSIEAPEWLASLAT